MTAPKTFIALPFSEEELILIIDSLTVHASILPQGNLDKSAIIAIRDRLRESLSGIFWTTPRLMNQPYLKPEDLDI